MCVCACVCVCECVSVCLHAHIQTNAHVCVYAHIRTNAHFVAGLIYINHTDAKTTAHMAFSLLDLNQDGKVCVNDLGEAMKALKLQSFQNADSRSSSKYPSSLHHISSKR